MKKFFIGFICILVLLLVTPLSIIGYSHSLPQQYGATYYAGMSDKFARLNSIKERKIVLIGGSNLPFGIDSTLIEKEIGIKVVNFGLYAALGSKTTLDLSKTNINKDDIIIFIPEYSAQTYSKYIDGHTMLQVLESNRNMFFKIPLSDYPELIADYPKYISEKRKFIIEGTTPNPGGVYSRNAFNEYGDISYKREYNIMPDGYDTTMPIVIDKSIIDNSFVDYFNSYIKWTKRQGAVVYFSFPPINESSLSPESTFEKRLEFYEHVRNILDCKIISNIEDYIINKDYFYDTNYHLNDSGVIYRTAKLIGDIKRVLNINTVTDIIVPPGSGLKPDVPGEGDDLENSEDFIFDEGEHVAIIAVKETSKIKNELIVPSIINGKKVYKISSDTFAGCNNLKSISIPKTVTVLEDYAFRGAGNLVSVKLLLDTGSNTFPIVGDNLLIGTSPIIKIYVPKSKLSDMKIHYTWSKYASYLLEL